MDEACISYPCAVKVDMSSCGRGGWLVKDADELSAVLRQMREVCGWKDPIVFQEFIPGVREVPSFQFYQMILITSQPSSSEEILGIKKEK